MIIENVTLAEKCKQMEADSADKETQLNMMLSKISDLEEENANLTKDLEEHKLKEGKNSTNSNDQAALQSENDKLIEDNGNLKEQLMKLQNEYMKLKSGTSK